MDASGLDFDLKSLDDFYLISNQKILISIYTNY